MGSRISLLKGINFVIYLLKIFIMSTISLASSDDLYDPFVGFVIFDIANII